MDVKLFNIIKDKIVELDNLDNRIKEVEEVQEKIQDKEIKFACARYGSILIDIDCLEAIRQELIKRKNDINEYINKYDICKI